MTIYYLLCNYISSIILLYLNYPLVYIVLEQYGWNENFISMVNLPPRFKLNFIIIRTIMLYEVKFD